MGYVEAHAAEGVDFFLDLHGGKFGGDGRAGSRGYDDGGHDGGQFARETDHHEVGDVDAEAEGAQLRGGQHGDGEPEQEIHQGNDADGARAHLVHFVYTQAHAKAAAFQRRDRVQYMASTKRSMPWRSSLKKREFPNRPARRAGRRVPDGGAGQRQGPAR